MTQTEPEKSARVTITNQAAYCEVVLRPRRHMLMVLANLLAVVIGLGLMSAYVGDMINGELKSLSDWLIGGLALVLVGTSGWELAWAMAGGEQLIIEKDRVIRSCRLFGWIWSQEHPRTALHDARWIDGPVFNYAHGIRPISRIRFGIGSGTVDICHGTDTREASRIIAVIVPEMAGHTA